MLLELRLGASGEVVELSEEVLAHLAQHRQLSSGACEAGGQLFGSFQGKTITLQEATGPRRGDRRSRYSYQPDRKAEQREIDERFKRGLHFFGDWHTHPEPRPNPSRTDIEKMKDCVRRSKRELASFLLLIVGTEPFPAGLHASLHDGGGMIPLIVHVLEEIPR